MIDVRGDDEHYESYPSSANPEPSGIDIYIYIKDKVTLKVKTPRDPGITTVFQTELTQSILEFIRWSFHR
jgi:hypothetical protein